MFKISEEELRNLYQKQYLTDKEIGKKFKVHQNTITKYRKSFGIPPIMPRERERILKGGFKEITSVQMEILLGSLLGDASLKGSSKNSRHLNISHSIKQKDYLEWIYEEIKDICPSGLSEYIDKNGYASYSILTEARKEFKNIYDNLYFPKKTVTKWILDRLTGLSLATWYMDDGSYNQSKSEFCFATNCFSEEEHYLMKEELKDKFGIDFLIRHIKKPNSYQFNLIVEKDSENKFIETVLPYIPKLMMYKMPSEDRFAFLLKNIKITVSKEDLQEMYWNKKMAQDQIAFKLGVSRQTIQNYMHLFQISKRTNSEIQKNKNMSRNNKGGYKKIDLTKEQEETALRLFRQLRGSGFPYYVRKNNSDYCTILERLQKRELEKDESNNYTFSSSGMSIIRDCCPQIFNMSRKDSLSPLEIFSNDKMLLDCIRRTIRYARKQSIASIRSGLKTYRNNRSISNFPPLWAKSIINQIKMDNATMLDFSSGFGGRLLGAYSSGKIKKYIGVDPCLDNYKSVKDIGEIINYHAELSNKDFSWELHNNTAESFLKSYNDTADLILTSPPYFDLEVYEDNNNQSYISHNNYDIWLNEWLSPIISNCSNILNEGGNCCIFISNNKKHNIMNDTKVIMENAFNNCITQGFSLPNIEYNRNKNLKRFDYCLISNKEVEK